MIEIRKYRKEDKKNWNDFISIAKNGTFLFNRDFMDYHEDRFSDYSIIIEVDKKIVALLPANIEGNIISSHAGLTYGGFVFGVDTSVQKNIFYIKNILEYLDNKGISQLKLKCLPDFYSKCSQAEIEYAMFLLQAENYRIDTALVLEYGNNFTRKMPKGRKSEISKAKKNDVFVEESKTCNFFWNYILIPNLKNRFNVAPVHNLKEIMLLKNNNPNNIKQFHAVIKDEVVAGATIFETDTTIHLQYLAGNDRSRETGALDFLFYELINLYANKKKFFDFGIVNENGGEKINIGMLKWKESFGTRVGLHKFFAINTNDYNKLDIANYSSK